MTKQQFLQDLETNPITLSIEVETNEGRTNWEYEFESTPFQVEGTKVKDGCINVIFSYEVKGEFLATANVLLDMETRGVLDYQVTENNIPNEQPKEPYHYLTTKAY
jgi:hypothetical protein